VPFEIKQKISGAPQLPMKYIIHAHQPNVVGIHVRNVTNYLNLSCIRKKHPMIVKCWNCHTEFEHLSSAENSNKLTAQNIIKVLQDNMFDVQRGGVIVINPRDFIEEVAEILEENFNG
jgi:hypothetical protein